MKLKIGNVEVYNNVVIAPMAGVTNTTFRSICKNYCAGLVVGEMVSDKGLLYDSKKTFELLKYKEEERPISQQLFGSDPDEMGRAAKIIYDYMHPDIIDINMGCPVPKVAVKNNAGSSLLKNPELVFKIVSSVVSMVPCPVTVKMRIGWDSDTINAKEIAKICEKAGASAIFVHGRTRKQGYTGQVNLDAIKDVVESVSIPVIGNGDIRSVKDAFKMLEYTKCAGIMVGRAAIGNPWLIKDIVSSIENNSIIETHVTLKEKIDLMKYHLNELCKEKDEHLGVLEMRGLLMYYLKGLNNTKELKVALCKVNSKKEIETLLDKYYLEEKDN